MKKKEYSRFDLASKQLETAIMLFITGGDRFSVITLAGAADTIFSELVTREKKENFTVYLLKKENDKRKPQEIGKEINNMLFINALKHLDPGDDDYISFDAEECALGAISKAIANYSMLDGKNDKLIKGFWAWVRINLDINKYNIPPI